MREGAIPQSGAFLARDLKKERGKVLSHSQKALERETCCFHTDVFLARDAGKSMKNEE